MTRRSCSLDFGGTKLIAATGSVGGKHLLRRVEAPTPRDGPSSFAEMVRLAEVVLAGAPPAGIGVSFGGHVDSTTGTVRKSVQVPGWNSIKLGPALRRRFGAPVAIINDANAGALGEWHTAGLAGRSVLAYVTVSTGIGAGLVSGGEVIEGIDGLAGEIGHLVVDPGGSRCQCGRRGCAETVAAGPGMARRAALRCSMRLETRSGWLVPSATLTGLEVSMAAEAGDPVAVEVFSEAGRALAVIISTLIAVVNPHVITVGGGIARSGAVLWESLSAGLRELLWPEITTTVRLASSAYSPVLGAYALGSAVAREMGHSR